MKSNTLLSIIAIIHILCGNAPAQLKLSDQEFALPPSPHLPDLTPGYVLIEGDIQVPEEEYAEFTQENQRQATFGGVTYWPANTVPFDFVTSGMGAVSAANQTAAINAMTDIAARAGINFRAATGNDANRIRFQNSTFNNSPVGMRGGTQIINIVSWGNQIIICHEIYHSLGFWHEQSRLDRNTYVTINANNICGSGATTACTAGTGMGECCFCMDNANNCTSCASNFNIQNQSSAYGPYDFDSFMHYGRADFSCNTADTITVNAPWNAQWQNLIGQRTHFSYFDGITCRALYPFPNDRWLDRAHGGTANGTFQEPYKNAQLAGALAGVPSGGTLFLKYAATYSAVGTHTKPVTLVAPYGAVLGN